MSIMLYQYPGGDGLGSVSSPCLRVDMALRWLGVEFERKNLRRGGDVRKVSATGKLPAIDIDGERIVESTSILDELERRYDVPWTVDDERQAAHLRLWEYAINDYFYWFGFYARWVDPDGRKRFLDALLSRVGTFTRFMVHKVIVPQRIKRAMMHGVGGRTREDVLREIECGLDLLVTDLHGGPFLLARDRPSRADLTVCSLFAQAGFGDGMPEVMQAIERRASVKPYLQRVCDVVGGDKPRWLR